MRAIRILEGELVASRRQLDLRLRLRLAEVQMRVIDRNGIAGLHCVKVDQKMVMPGIGLDVAGGLDGHALDAKHDLERARHRGAILRLDEVNGLVGFRRRLATAHEKRCRNERERESTHDVPPDGWNERGAPKVAYRRLRCFPS